MRAPSDPADVCIVGSGPAGAILAASLADRGRDVVVLEAGRRFERSERLGQMERFLRPEHPDQVWEMGGPRDRFTAAGSHDYNLNGSRVKGVGGTTLHWGAITPRLHPEDFAKRSRYGVGTDWPITYATLKPYYLRAEAAMGVAGASHRFSPPRTEAYPMDPVPASYSDRLLDAACDRLGIDLHPVPRAINTESYDGRSECVGYGTCDPVCPSGAKYDASVHVRKAESRGARVIDRAPVQRLEHDGAGGRVVGAVYVTPDGTEHVQRARTFVVACGAVETVRLLMLSASDRHPDGLANGSGLLGRYFMDHPGVSVTGRLDEPTRQHLVGYSTRMSKQFYDHDRGPEGSLIIELSNTAGPPPVTAALRENPRSDELVRGDVTAALGADDWSEDRLDRVADRSTRRVRLNAWVEQLPDPDNRVGLDRSNRDDHGNPVPEITYRIAPRTREKLERAEAILVAILEELGASEIEAEHSSEDPFTAYHQMGVTRMGTDPDASVVTPQLRAHHLSNLYISSSGVFVTGGASNPTLTIAALTLRLADHLDEQLEGAGG
jgi:choline dehydrogenase-like flavoprotein